MWNIRAQWSKGLACCLCHTYLKKRRMDCSMNKYAGVEVANSLSKWEAKACFLTNSKQENFDQMDSDNLKCSGVHGGCINRKKIQKYTFTEGWASEKVIKKNMPLSLCMSRSTYICSLKLVSWLSPFKSINNLWKGSFCCLHLRSF